MKLKLIIVVAAALSVAALSAGCASEKKEKTPSQKGFFNLYPEQERVYSFERRI